LDQVYRLPYTRKYHPSYEKSGGVPAIKEVKFSLTSSRGCFGGCHFCAIGFHQGKGIQIRSHESLMSEAKDLVQEKDFKGYIHDLGGPTANFRIGPCEKQKVKGFCSNRNCFSPEPCNKLNPSHEDYLSLLEKIRKIPEVKKVFIRSGIRYDYLLLDKQTSFLDELIKHHVSGQLKIAPEHISTIVLELMGKTKKSFFINFAAAFKKKNQKFNKKQFIIPYFISGHPGSDLKASIELAEFIRDSGFVPDQVQDFYPTPGTLSTAMYYTELDPKTKLKVYVPKSIKEKKMQKALLHYKKAVNYSLVFEALKKGGRMDLIGNQKNCLISFKNKKTNRKKRN
jgi:uncharacterized radical SAM protein YgiQ